MELRTVVDVFIVGIFYSHLDTLERSIVLNSMLKMYRSRYKNREDRMGSLRHNEN